MRIEHYISELLYRYNCVVVPGFGAFLANTNPARIDQNSQTFYPPSKSLSFNRQLNKNDGLLVSHIADTKKLSYDELLEEVENTSKKWTEMLESGKQLFLEGIGRLWLGEENKILFTPENDINYLISSFGLASFTASPLIREKLKQEVEALEEQVPFTITPEKRETAGIRPFLKYAAIFLLLLSTGISGYQFYNQKQGQQEVVIQDAQKQVKKYIQEATFFEASPVELPALNLNVKKKVEGPRHHIIAGAFRYKENADKKIEQLKSEGYQALHLGANAYGLHQVAYASFSDSREALQFLRQIKASVSSDAWMLSER